MSHFWNNLEVLWHWFSVSELITAPLKKLYHVNFMADSHFPWKQGGY